MLDEYKKKLNKENVEKTMAANIKVGNNFFIRILPLFLKQLSVSLGYIEIRKHTTTTLSNIGQVKINDAYKKYVQNFLLLIAPESVEKIKCSVISYENTLVFTFTSVLKETEIATFFFDFLRKSGINVDIESNGVYESLS